MKLKHVPDFKGERGQRMIDSYNELPDASDRPNIPRILIRAVTPSLYYLGLVLAGCGILQAAIMVPLFLLVARQVPIQALLMLGGQVGLSLAVDLAIFVWGVSWRRKKIDILRQGMLGEAEICGITSSMWGFKLKVTVNGFEAVEYVPRYMVDYLQKVKESPDNRLDVIYSPDIPGEVIIPLKSILKAR